MESLTCCDEFVGLFTCSCLVLAFFFYHFSLSCQIQDPLETILPRMMQQLVIIIILSFCIHQTLTPGSFTIPIMVIE